MLRFITEKPPVQTQAKVVTTASYRGRPARRKARISAPVRTKYIIYKIWEDWTVLGTSLEKMGPGTSAWTSTWVRPPTRGRKASVKSSTPMPPIQEAKDRQNRMPRGRASMSARTVPPEVVKPETISKRQSAKL